MAQESYRRAHLGPRQEAPPRPPTGIREFIIDGKHILVLGRKHFLVRSDDPVRRREGIWYGVQLEPDSEDGLIPGCSCDGYMYHGYCWHIRLANEMVGRFEEFGGGEMRG
jgi:hypothetical protein